MRRKIQTHEIMNPERVTSHMIRDYVEGKLDDNRSILRATVVAIDTIGGQFEDDPPNPQNSIRARIVTEGINANTEDDDLPIFWPISPHTVQPIKEKEHVHVIFEDVARRNGYWLGRTAEPLDVDSANFVPGTAKYLERSQNDLTTINSEQRIDGLAQPPTDVEVSSEFVIEPVPIFHHRVGDHVIHGSNNTMIVLGRDRPADVATGLNQGAGTIDLVAGRQTAPDMDMQNDKSRVYISEQTNVDVNFRTDSIGINPPGPASAAVVIANNVRLIARDNMKIVVESGNITIEGATITLGNNATEHAVLGDQLASLLRQLIQEVAMIQVPTAVGPSGPPLRTAMISQLSELINGIISATVKVKN